MGFHHFCDDKNNKIQRPDFEQTQWDLTKLQNYMGFVDFVQNPQNRQNDKMRINNRLARIRTHATIGSCLQSHKYFLMGIATATPLG